MGLKFNSTLKVLTSVSGGIRLALNPYLGIIHRFDDMEDIRGFYSEARKGWVISERPDYSSGGWGSGSTGDRDGSYTYENARQLLTVIGARIWEVNIDVENLSNLSVFESLQKKTDKIVALKKRARQLGLNPDLTDFEKTGLKVRDGTSHYDKVLNQGRGINPAETVEKYENAVAVFLNGKGKATVIDSYRIEKNSVHLDKTLVAFRSKEGKVILNSQSLPCSEFERKVLGGQSIIQKKIREVASLSIPLNVLDSAGLKLNETRVIESGPEETFEIKGQDRHFTGSLLLENSGRKFLMDLDRREVEHGIWNPFFCEVDSKSDSIKSAYDSMTPEEVKTAQKNGVPVLRQGEWFFIDTGKSIEIGKGEAFSWETEENKTKFGVLRSQISHGKGRPNTLFRVQNHTDKSLNGLVCGIVEHSGREHAPLNLGGTVKEFHGHNHTSELKETELKYVHTSLDDGESMTLKLWKVVPNTTVSNFTIQGDVD